ncbi:MAG: urease accessory protein UreE [Vicinamibacterales bacterium]
MALFRSVPVVEAVFAEDRLPAALAAYPRDTVTLGWQARMGSRGRWTTDGGVDFGTALPRGTILRDGDCLAIDRLPLLVVVREQAEPVLVARPASIEEAARWAYQVGNSHQPLMIDDGLLVCPDEHGAADVFAYHGIPFERESRRFTPVSSGPGHHG